MNRAKDFHKKTTGTLINKNTKDYRRAKNRNAIMKATQAIVGEDGELAKVKTDVQEFKNQPSRATEEINALKSELEATRNENKAIKETLEAALADTENMKQQVDDYMRSYEEVKDKFDNALVNKNEFLQLKQRLENLENN